MKMKWANAVHQILNYLGIVLVLVELMLPGAGCVRFGDSWDCSRSLIPPQYAMLIIGAIFAIKQLISVARDGLASLFKIQPPIK